MATFLPVLCEAGSGLIQPLSIALSAIAHSIGLDGDRDVVDVERAGRFARRRADAAGDFREVVGRVKVARRLFPVAAIDEVVPVRDLVVDRAAVVTIRDAAIHAARGLVARFLLGKRQDEFAIILDPLLDRSVIAILAFDFEKAGDLTHGCSGHSAASVPAAPARACHFLQRAAIFERHDFCGICRHSLPVVEDRPARALNPLACMLADIIAQALRHRSASCR